MTTLLLIRHGFSTSNEDGTLTGVNAGKALITATAIYQEEMISAEFVNKHIVISDRATLMNILLKTDAYTVGTGLMPSALNEGKIISIPLESNSCYSVGYITRNDRKTTPVLEKFISLILGFGECIKS